VCQNSSTRRRQHARQVHQHLCAPAAACAPTESVRAPLAWPRHGMRCVRAHTPHTMQVIAEYVCKTANSPPDGPCADGEVCMGGSTCDTSTGLCTCMAPTFNNMGLYARVRARRLHMIHRWLLRWPVHECDTELFVVQSMLSANALILRLRRVHVRHAALL
jgi:hypothetical protein